MEGPLVVTVFCSAASTLNMLKLWCQGTQTYSHYVTMVLCYWDTNKIQQMFGGILIPLWRFIYLYCCRKLYISKFVGSYKMSLDQELRSNGLMLLYPWRMTYLALLTPPLSGRAIKFKLIFSYFSVPGKFQDGVTTKMCPDVGQTFLKTNYRN